MHGLDHDDLRAHGRRMRALAVRLVGHDAADDVVQDAWVSALARPPRRTGPLGPWLQGVVLNVGRMWRRSERRRRQREAHARPREEAPDPLGTLSSAEVAERLARAVRGLPDPYREVVVLRIYEGLPPRDVARRTGVPVETVRTRYRRALERLRHRLDAEHPGGRGGWMASVAGVWGLLPTPTVSAHAAAAAGMGALIMKKSLVLLGVLLLVAAVGGVGVILHGARHTEESTAQLDGNALGLPSRQAPDHPNEAAHLEGRPGAPVPTGSDGAAGAPTAASPSPTPAAEGNWLESHRGKTGPDVLEGVVFVEREPAREGRVLVHVVGFERREPSLDPEADDVHVLPIGPDGRFRLDPVGAEGTRLLQMELRVPGHAPRFLEPQVWDVTHERRFLHLGTATVEGVVRDADGRSVFEAEVAVTWAGAPTDGLPATARTRTQPDGAYRIEGLAAGPYRVTVTYPASDDRADPDAWRWTISLTPGETLRLDLGGDRAYPLLRGTVLTMAGAAVRGAGRLLLSRADGDEESLAITFDDRGRFRAPLPSGTWRIRIEAAGWHASEARDVEAPIVVAEEDVDLDLALPGGRVFGDVRGARSGDLVRSARVRWKEKGASYPAAFHDVPAVDGAFVIDGLQPGIVYEIWSSDGPVPQRSKVLVELRAGEVERRVDLRDPGR